MQTYTLEECLCKYDAVLSFDKKKVKKIKHKHKHTYNTCKEIIMTTANFARFNICQSLIYADRAE